MGNGCGRNNDDLPEKFVRDDGGSFRAGYGALLAGAAMMAIHVVAGLWHRRASLCDLIIVYRAECHQEFLRDMPRS